jgi:hypothetical protein
MSDDARRSMATWCNGSGFVCVCVVTRDGTRAAGWLDGVGGWGGAGRWVHGRAALRFVCTGGSHKVFRDDFLGTANHVGVSVDRGCACSIV